jgi:hypothetical protein
MASLSPSRLFGFSPAVAKPRTGATPLFAVTVFVSAGLVFLVEPMIGKLLLPLLGGAPAVWNTSLAFFQVALLLGYAYAHLLQRLPSFRMQVGVHGIVLLLAALTLPLHISRVFGDPDPARPIAWMLGVLTLSVGAPFAALSATAPLVQAWFALTAPRDADGKAPQPYSLYAASNLGSLLALVAYPAVIEPLTHLSSQRLGWSLGYVALAVLIMSLGLTQKVQAARTETQVRTARPALAKMATWVFLAAVPSSLMMGVTSYLSTDVATAPFLWVVPLALYLLTFIIAFSSKALLSPSTTLIVQAIAACLCLYFIPFQGLPIPLQLSIHLLCFFLTALMCHSALSAARPEPDHLTLFYLCVSLGGVIGGSFNAFLTPVIFPTVIEYPLVVVLACLARPQGFSANVLKLKKYEMACLAAGVVAGVTGLWLATVLGDNTVTQTAFKITCFIAIGAALVLRDRGLWMAVLLGLVAAGGQIGETGRTVNIERSFFGVSKIIDANDPVLGPVRKMVHGTTLHGAQALTPGRECQTMTYYNPSTAIGQTITGLEAHNPSMNMAVVGLGAGAMANYVRASDHLAFFEIDPVVARLANDPKYFTFTTHCAKGPLSFHMGDARLTLAPLPTHQLDLLMVDAFSSDAVPAHLLTVESVKMYLSKVKPGGLVLFHLSNRHLELRDPVIAAIAEAGGVSLQQRSTAPSNKTVAATSSVVVIASPTAEGLATFRADPRWTTRDPGTVKAWTDDYMNLIGAMLRHKNDGK